MCHGQRSEGLRQYQRSAFPFQGITLNPAVNRGVIDIHSAFRQHLLQLTVTDAVFAVPAYGPQNDVTLKMPVFECLVQLHQQRGWYYHHRLFATVPQSSPSWRTPSPTGGRIWNGKACWNGMSKTAIWPRMWWMTTRWHPCWGTDPLTVSLSVHRQGRCSLWKTLPTSGDPFGDGIGKVAGPAGIAGVAARPMNARSLNGCAGTSAARR